METEPQPRYVDDEGKPSTVLLDTETYRAMLEALEAIRLLDGDALDPRHDDVLLERVIVGPDNGSHYRCDEQYIETLPRTTYLDMGQTVRRA